METSAPMTFVLAGRARIRPTRIPAMMKTPARSMTPAPPVPVPGHRKTAPRSIRSARRVCATRPRGPAPPLTPTKEGPAQIPAAGPSVGRDPVCRRRPPIAITKTLAPTTNQIRAPDASTPRTLLRATTRTLAPRMTAVPTASASRARSTARTITLVRTMPALRAPACALTSTIA